MPSPKSYSRMQIALHWIVAVLIVAQVVLHEGIAKAWHAVEDGAAQAVVFPADPIAAMHIIGGMLILVFAFWRLTLRASHGVPDLPASTQGLARTAAHLGHVALYGLMIVAPITGMVAWFGVNDGAAEVHELAKPLTILLVAGHVVMALYHHFILKDGLLNRMRRSG
jgi:cytochrome b561